MAINRRDFLKSVTSSGAMAIIPPGFVMKALESIVKKNSATYSDIGMFLRAVAGSGSASQKLSMDLVPDGSGGAVMPERLAKIFKQASIKAGVINRLRKDKFIALFYVTEELLIDSAELGAIICESLCSEIEKAAMKTKHFAGQNITEFRVTAKYTYANQCFRITMKAS